MLLTVYSEALLAAQVCACPEAMQCPCRQQVEPAAEDEELADAVKRAAAGTGDKKKFARDLLGDDDGDDDMEE